MTLTLIREDNATEASEDNMKTRLKELANKYGLSHTYDSRNLKTAIVEKFNQPTQVVCFKFVIDSPWTEDLKMMIEDCFEELIRACIINKSFVIVEHASKKLYTEEELTDWMGNRVVELQPEGKTLEQYVLSYLENDCFEIICLGTFSVNDIFEAKLSLWYIVLFMCLL